MTTVKVALNSEGVRKLLNAPGVRADLARRAQAIARAAGPGNMATPARTGHQRARAAVVTVSDQAKVHEARDHRLTAAIDSGR